MYPHRVPLLPTPSTTRPHLVQKLLSFLHAAQEYATLSPQIFDTWFIRLSSDERATVREILHALQGLSWPTEIRFPNIIALGNWMRERRVQRAKRAEVVRAVREGGGEEGGQEASAGQDEQERDEAMSVLEQVLQDFEKAVEGVERMCKEYQEVGCGSTATEPTSAEPASAEPTSAEPTSIGSTSTGPTSTEPTCPGLIIVEPSFAEPQPATPLHDNHNNNPDTVHMDILAILVMLFAPSLLLRMLLVMFVLSRICLS